MILYNRTSYKENKNNNPLYWPVWFWFVLFSILFHRNIRMDKSVFEYYATQTGLFLPNARVCMVKSLSSLPVRLHSFETLTDHRSRFSLAGLLFVDVRNVVYRFLNCGLVLKLQKRTCSTLRCRRYNNTHNNKTTIFFSLRIQLTIAVAFKFLIYLLWLLLLCHHDKIYQRHFYCVKEVHTIAGLS